MSRAGRFVLVGAAVAVAALAFVLARPAEETARTDTIATPARDPGRTATRVEPRPSPRPATTRIVVRGGEPVGGVRSIEAKKREVVRLSVSSPDTSDEVHVHGYDLSRDLAAGGRVSFRFRADVEGVFEIELERTHTPIAKLVVEPS